MSKINPQGNALFDKELAGVALNLGTDDRTQIQAVYPWPERITSKVEVMRKLDVNIFGSEEYRLQRKTLGTLLKSNNNSICKGNIESVKILEGNKWIRVSGWAASKNSTRIVITNSQNRITGYGLMGQERPDVKALYKELDKRSGFVAYSEMFPENNLYKLWITNQNGDLDCQTTFVAGTTLIADIKESDDRQK
jgi:hypothetical protein